MRKLISIFTLILMITFNIIFGQEKQMEKIKNIITEVKNEFAPDKRTSIFSVEVKEISGKIVLNGEVDNIKAKTALFDKLNLSKITVIDEIELLPEKELGEKRYGVINLSVANARTNPEHSAELATQTLLGTAVRVLKKQAGWYLIQTPDKYIAWVDNDGIKLMTLEEVNNWIKAKKVIYLNEFSFVYSQPDKKSLRVSDIVIGDLLKYIETGEKFTKVEYPNGKIGYIENEFVNDFDTWMAETNPNGESVVETAKKFIGMPYLWGGTSAKAMDCSGFSKTVYFMNGVLLQRDASQQVLTGDAIDTKNGFENCIAGDLLFFGSKAEGSKKERITHVAIYIGNNDFIHSAGEISIDSFDKNKPNFNEYRLKQFIRAKRILSSLDKNGIYTLKNYGIYKGETFNED